MAEGNLDSALSTNSMNQLPSQGMQAQGVPQQGPPGYPQQPPNGMVMYPQEMGNLNAPSMMMDAHGKSQPGMMNSQGMGSPASPGPSPSRGVVVSLQILH
jgi:hypothetical protein